MQGSIKIESRGLRGKGNLLDRLFREAAFEATREAYNFTQAKSLRLTVEDVAGADFFIVPSPKVFDEIKSPLSRGEYFIARAIPSRPR